MNDVLYGKALFLFENKNAENNPIKKVIKNPKSQTNEPINEKNI